jgi:membrane protease YdiL (CAAX protease family)
MRTLFFDNSDRLRSGWRALIFFVVFGLIAFALIGVSLVVMAQFPMPESAAAPLRLAIPFAASAIVAVLVGWLCGRYFDRVPYRSLGASATQGWLSHLLLGLALGGATFVIALLIAMASGGLRIDRNAISSNADITATLLSTLIIFAVGAASEETLFRGYLLQTFMRSDHLNLAVALTAFLFAAAHGGNPGVNGLAWANTLLAGIWFAVAYLKTRDLWLPFGIHLAWNWLQGPVFGISVSGITGFAADPLMRATDNGPAWLTGGEYGIEGGVACLVALAISTVVIWKMPGVQADPELVALTSPNRSVS